MEEKLPMNVDSRRRIVMRKMLDSGCGMWSPILPPESVPREVSSMKDAISGGPTASNYDLSSSTTSIAQPEAVLDSA